MATSVRKPRVSAEEFEDSKEDAEAVEESGSEEGSEDGEDGSDDDEEGSEAPQDDFGASDDDDDDDDDDDNDDDDDDDDDGEGDEEVAGEDGSDDEQGDNEEEEGGDEEEQGESNPNAGWADVMAKILQKETPNSKLVILQKNKQLEKRKEKAKEEMLERRKLVDKRKAWEMIGRVKPDIVKDREIERNMQRTATRGVVQLFNAVRKHQKDVDEKVKEAGGSERKKAKILSSVSKKDFINVLRGTEGPTESAKTLKAEVKEEEEEKGKPAWSVLRDDYMMGASMKDWDKESDEEPGSKQAGAGDDYSDSD
ncbi:RRP15-like protein [Engraulis encrasicolus]|uniref:RRP15-like protein n=1 Tax=Engraulis encrasicolus TaxID=184585 RepID=UPI002FD2DF01